MRKSVILLVSGGIILVAGFLILAVVAQSAVSEIRKKEYTLGPRETTEIREIIEREDFFSGVYAVEVLEPPESSVRIEVRDPNGSLITQREFDTPFVIESFDVVEDGVYVLAVENMSTRDVIRIAAALGGQLYSDAGDPMVTVAMPSYITITGIIILIAGAVVYYRERAQSRFM